MLMNVQAEHTTATPMLHVLIMALRSIVPVILASLEMERTVKVIMFDKTIEKDDTHTEYSFTSLCSFFVCIP